MGREGCAALSVEGYRSFDGTGVPLLALKDRSRKYFAMGGLTAGGSIADLVMDILLLLSFQF